MQIIKNIIPILILIGIAFSLYLINKGIKRDSPVIVKHMDPNMTFYNVYDQTYGVNVSLVICRNADSSVRFIRNNFNINATLKDFNGNVGMTYVNNDGQILIWLYQFSLDPEDLQVFNHEIFHVVYGILGGAGITLSPASEEVFAYETSFLSREFYKQIYGK